MFYLIYIKDTCEPGRMYGPDTYEVCYEKMQLFYAEDRQPFDAVEYTLYDDHLIDEDTGEGWYIIQTNDF